MDRKNTHSCYSEVVSESATSFKKTERCGNTFSITKYKGFTLVELIVVITILTILGTIGFIQLGGFQSNARDSVRTSDLTNLSKGLDVFQIKTGSYPIPTGVVSYTRGVTGGAVLQQGGLNGSLVGFSQAVPLDPLTKTGYVYSVLGNGQYYQIGAEAENTLSRAILPLMEEVYADGPKTALVKGNYVSDPSLPSLIVIPSSVPAIGSGGIFSPNVAFVTNGSTTNFVSTSTGYVMKKDMVLKNQDSRLVGYWDMETLCFGGSCGNGNDGYVKNLASTDINILSGTTLRNHNNAIYSTKTATGNAILGVKSAYITDFDSALQTSGNIKEIDKSMTITMLLKPNFSTNINGNFSNIWDRNFLYDYVYDRGRLAMLTDKDNFYSYKYSDSSGNQGAYAAKGFNFQKDRTYLITVSQTNSLTGGVNNSSMKIFINGILQSDNSVPTNYSSYSNTGAIMHFGSSIANPEICGPSGGDIRFVSLESGCTFNGTFDDIKIYNQALSDGEIKQQARTAGF